MAKNKKFKIGIPVWEIGKNTLGVTKGYIGFCRRFGEVVFLDPEHELREDLDCIVIPGGADVDTKRFGQAPGLFTGKPDIYKEWFDFEYLEKYIQQGTPIFAICRGMQSLWVHFGGELHQDLMLDCDSWDHSTNDADDPFKVMHQATVEPAYALNRNKGQRRFAVNSRHHQVCDETITPEGLDVFSRCIIDQTVEGFIHITLPIVAFQHHPEDCHSDLAYTMMADLLETKKSLFE